MRNGQPVREKSTKKKAAPVKGGKTAPAKPRTASPRSNAPTTANGAATNANKTRQRILDVATQEFSAKGYDGARIDDIMRLSKVSKNLIYHYFGSKRGLIESLFEETVEQLLVALRQLRHPHPAVYQVIEAVVDVYFTFIRSKPAFYRLQLALYFAPQESEGYKAAGKYYVIQRALVIEILQAGQLALGRSAGEWQATTLIGLINCCASAYLNGEIKLTAKIRKDLTRQFLYGVTGKDQE